MKRYMILAVILFAAMSCRKEPSAAEFDGEFLVYTAKGEQVDDFSGYDTFTVADSLLYIEGAKGKRVLDDWTKSIRSQYIKQMTSLGYRYVDTGKDDNDQNIPIPETVTADLGLQVSYIVSTDYFTSGMPAGPYWWYAYPGYWYPGYWGTWGAWYYSFPVTYSYSSHSLLTEMVDLTAEQGQDKTLPVLWNSYIDGSMGNSRYDKARFSKAIDQSFAQSGYLKK